VCSSDLVRARYRHGMAEPSPIEPGLIVDYEIGLSAISYLIPRGDRLRVDIASSCFDRYDRNLNTNDPIGHGTTPHVATQTIHHDAAHPSHIMLPVIPCA
jgi:predicted acyl esterase